MRTFITTKPNVKFFGKSNVSVHVLPDYIEYIIKLERGFYGVVNVMPESSTEVSVCCFWGKYFDRMKGIKDKSALMDKLVKGCPNLVKVLSASDEVKFAEFRNVKNEGYVFLMRQKVDFSDGWMDAILNKEIKCTVFKVLNKSLQVYWEINDHCPLKAWVDGLEVI